MAASSDDLGWRLSSPLEITTSGTVRGELGPDMSEVTRPGLDDPAQRRRLVAWCGVWAVLLGGALAALSVPINHQPPLDGRILLAVNAVAARIPEISVAVMIFDANAAELLLATSIVVLWFLARGVDAHAMRRRALLTAIAFFPTYLIARVLQGLDHRARPILGPLHLQPLTDPATWHQMRINFTDWGSFPSDHAALIAIVLVAAFSVDRRAGIAFAVLGLVVGLFRVAVGYHWPSDIVGGTLLGMLVAVVLFALEGKLRGALDAILDVIAARRALSYALAFVVLSDVAHGFSTMRLLAHSVFHAHLFH
jgi:undecaprenyl-diphosphatase